MGKELSLIWAVPFAGMLLSIALLPLFAPHFWHHHFRKISIGWAAALAIPFLLVYQSEAYNEILHIFLLDYVPFVILLWALFTVSGGILVRGSLAGTPAVNSTIILIGTAIASWIGTTGASMLLIRPLLRANSNRRHRTHTVIFFIFLVSNIGGALTPLGDPPLFLGFLHGVPFFWTLTNLFPHFLFSACVLIMFYFLLDAFMYRRETEEARSPILEREPLRVDGLLNFVWIAGVIVGVLISGYWKPDHLEAGSWIQNGELVLVSPHEHHGHEHEDHGHEHEDHGHHDDTHTDQGGPASHVEHSPSTHSLGEEMEGSHGVAIPVQNLARDGLLIVMGLLSLLCTPKAIREANGFSWFPIKEVAWLFAGIFMTIIPALEILKAGNEGAMAMLIQSVRTPIHYFWATGILSSFLDNAPTYLTFLNTSLGQFFPGQPESVAVPKLIAEANDYLVAISVGAVFMGANTYIGNAPNFMVRSIAEESGVPMPDFFSYMFKYSIPVLGTTFAIVTVVFFWN